MTLLCAEQYEIGQLMEIFGLFLVLLIPEAEGIVPWHVQANY